MDLSRSHPGDMEPRSGMNGKKMEDKKGMYNRAPRFQLPITQREREREGEGLNRCYPTRIIRRLKLMESLRF